MIIRKPALGATNAASTDARASSVTSRPPGCGNRAFDGQTIQWIESDRRRIFKTGRRRIRIVIVEPTRTVFLIQVQWHKPGQVEEDVDECLNKTFAGRGASRHVDYRQSNFRGLMGGIGRIA